MTHRFEQGLAALSTMAMHVAVGLMALMALIGFADVVLSYAFKAPLPAANDLASAMLPLVVVLAMCHIQRGDGHIAVDLITNLLPPALDRMLQCVGYLSAAVVLAGIAWAAWSLAVDSVVIGERAIGAVRFPVWPSKLVFATGLTVAALEAVAQLVVCVWRPGPAMRGRA